MNESHTETRRHGEIQRLLFVPLIEDPPIKLVSLESAKADCVQL